MNDVRRATIEMKSKSKELRYGVSSKKRFKTYFSPAPVKRSRGRPKGSSKRSRGRPKTAPVKEEPVTKRQAMIDMTKDDDAAPVIDLTVKQAEELDARLEKTLSKTNMTRERVNWDVAPFCSRRKRFADSWTNKNDLYCKGDSFGKFCIKTNIDRNVLRRYLAGKYKKEQESGQASKDQRGRPSFLTASVMRHLCEGWYLFCYACYVIQQPRCLTFVCVAS